MNPIVVLGSIEERPSRSPSVFLFGGAALTLEILAAALVVSTPLQFSIFTVFLFAGPHNWIEVRYFLERLPARWGRLRNFFLLSSGGIVGLTIAYAALPWL
ncbi:MAG: hypothetical protein WCH75_13125, partial [Candidatus Binatia bacterium]